MKSVLIFGAAGFVGNYLAKEFIAHGYVVNGSDKVDCCSSDHFINYKKVDLLNFNEVVDAFLLFKPDIVVNLAAVSSVGLSWEIPQATINVNVIGSLNILEASRIFNCTPKILFVGSSEEYAESHNMINESHPLEANNPYGISKLAQDRLVELYRKRYGMKIYYARPFNHTGVGQSDIFVLPSFCKQVAEIKKSGKPGVIKVGNLDLRRDFSDVRDVVRAYRLIIESNSYFNIYNIGSGNAYSLRELLNYIISLSNQNIIIEEDSTRYRKMENKIIYCDNSLIKQELGWVPIFSIKQTLRWMLNYYMKKI